jgi:hypothetical protein
MISEEKQVAVVESGTPNKSGLVQNQDLADEIKNRYDYVCSRYEDWIDAAKEDFRFSLGDQWDNADKEALKAQSRPALTFNRIRPIINIITGYQRENASRIKVGPEGGEDRIFSDSLDRILRFMDKRSHLSYKLGYFFDDGCYCGKGYLEAIWSYDRDPVYGDIVFKQRSPYQVYPDPDCIEYDLNEGHKYVFVSTRLSRGDIKGLFPEKAKLIDGFTVDTDDITMNSSGLSQDDDYGLKPEQATSIKMSGDDDAGGIQDGKFNVLEYWRTKPVDRFFVIDKEEGTPRRFDTQEEADKFVADQSFGKVIKRRVNEMWYATKVCGFILDDRKSPFEPWTSRYPIFRFLADWAPNAESEEFRVQGITRPLKDPQREKNKAKSQYLHILNTQANSGWKGEEDALDPEGWAELAKMGSKPGITIKIKKGKFGMLEEIQPKGPNTGQIVREEKADEEFKQIAGINPDLMGIQEGTASGRAISMRIKQAILALVRIFSNYRYSKEIVGMFLLEMMPALFTPAKFARVLGPDFMKKAIDQERYPDGLSEGHIQAFLTMIKDNQYDVFVADSDSNPTVRYETFQELSDLLQKGAPIPIDLLIDYMDIPNAEDVKKRIRENQAAAVPAKK